MLSQQVVFETRDPFLNWFLLKEVCFCLPSKTWMLPCYLSFRFPSAFSMRVVGMLPLLSPFFKGSWGLLGPVPVNSMDSRVRPGWVTSSLHDPYWWQRPPHKVPTGAILGFSIFDRILRHVAQFCPRGAGFEPAITGPPALPFEPQPPPCPQHVVTVAVILRWWWFTQKKASLPSHV